MAVPVGERQTSLHGDLDVFTEEEQMEMEECDRVNREFGSPHGDVVIPEVLPKQKRPSSLSPNPDYIV